MQEFRGRVDGVEVKPVDTTGAGDAFVGGILSSIASDPHIVKVRSFGFNFFKLSHRIPHFGSSHFLLIVG